MNSKLQETLDQLGAHIRGGCGLTELENSQAIKDLASRASEQFGGVFSRQYTESTKE